MWSVLLGLALAGDPEPPIEDGVEAPSAELIPGVKNAGLPPPVTNQLVPMSATEVQAPGLPAPAVDGLPSAPPPLPVLAGLPPPPPPIEQAGLPPMAQPIPMAGAELPESSSRITIAEPEEAAAGEPASEPTSAD